MPTRGRGEPEIDPFSLRPKPSLQSAPLLIASDMRPPPNCLQEAKANLFWKISHPEPQIIYSSPYTKSGSQTKIASYTKQNKITKKQENKIYNRNRLSFHILELLDRDFTIYWD